MTPLRSSIHRKLMLLVLSTAACALLLTGAAMLFYDLRSFRIRSVADLTAQADIVGHAAAPALEFADPQTAASYLESLRAHPGVIAAAIYGANGTLFASYASPEHAVRFPALPGRDGWVIQGNNVEIFRRIDSGAEILGTVYLRAQYDLWSRMRNYLGIVGGAIVLSLLAALAVSRRMQQNVTRPILEVAQVAKRVMDDRDFSLRARRTTDDEIGLLVDAFNNMLVEIDRMVAERERAEAALVESESRLLELNTQLEQRIEARTAELAAANKDLEGFSYSVSHDLRAPIRAIGGFAALLAEDHAAELSEEAGRKLGIIRNEALRMGRLIDDLLAFSRLGRKAIEPQDLDMTAIVNDVFGRLRQEEDARRVDFRLGTLPHARGDRSLFEQVWVNLLSNAVKFSAKRERPVVEVGGLVTETEHVYYVRDNGAGFDPRYKSKLFGVFQRLHREDDFPGTGVGLALVHRIVSRHGGRVWADGKPDEGATFHFSLPKEPDDGGV